MSSLFATTFYDSFCSAGRYPQSDRAIQSRPPAVFSEIEHLKVTATPTELDDFNEKVVKLVHDLDLALKMSLITPKEIAAKAQRLEEPDSFLDRIFVVKIPLIHDLLMMGEPEIQILKVEGSHDMVNLFNAHVDQIVYGAGMNVEVVVLNRKKIPVQEVVSKSLESMESTLDGALDYFFSDDFSRSCSTVHKIIVGSA
jgi:hypothetical protein